MEILSGGLRLTIPEGAFPLSTDSMVLADFVRLPKNAQVLDLGSGCGTIGLLLCVKDPDCCVTGVELNPGDHTAALENIRDNGLDARMKSLCGDLRAMPPEIAPGGYDICVSNPPYFSGGEASRKTPLARRDDCCPPEALFAAAARALRWGGDFFLVHRPEKLALLCHAACTAGLEPKLVRLVSHRPGRDPAMLLMQCRKGARPGLRLEQIHLQNPDGSPTEDYRRIYHI